MGKKTEELKKKSERDCLNLISLAKVKSVYAKNLLNVLHLNDIDSFVSSERPDFVFENTTMNVGVEHCMIDSLYNEKLASHSREMNTKIRRAVDKAKVNYSSEDAASFLCDCIKQELDATNRFKYETFLKSFKSICMKHNMNAKAYRENLENNCKQTKIVCLIEIPLSFQNTKYMVYENDNNHCLLLNSIPLTKGMVNLISQMSNFDYAIILTYFKEKKKKKCSLYIFDCKNIEISIREQRIHLYDSFDYYYKLSNVVTDYNEDVHGITFNINASS